uniref:Photosystem II subunit M n=1 Tax=Mammillaria zephyranthoides TaxID=278595 RepID=A0A5J6VBW1_9CARY|nr:photosystem II subunit M [Mammillaria zephyranthoides]
MGVNTLPLMATTLFVLVPTTFLLLIYFKIKDSF